jgi:hypothetical protein
VRLLLGGQLDQGDHVFLVVERLAALKGSKLLANGLLVLELLDGLLDDLVSD